MKAWFLCWHCRQFCQQEQQWCDLIVQWSFVTLISCHFLFWSLCFKSFSLAFGRFTPILILNLFLMLLVVRSTFSTCMLVIWNEKRSGSKWLVNIVKMSLFFCLLPENAESNNSSFVFKSILLKGDLNKISESIFHQEDNRRRKCLLRRNILRVWHTNEMNDYSLSIMNLQKQFICSRILFTRSVWAKDLDNVVNNTFPLFQGSWKELVKMKPDSTWFEL